MLVKSSIDCIFHSVLKWHWYGITDDYCYMQINFHSFLVQNHTCKKFSMYNTLRQSFTCIMITNFGILATQYPMEHKWKYVHCSTKPYNWYYFVRDVVLSKQWAITQVGVFAKRGQDSVLFGVAVGWTCSVATTSLTSACPIIGKGATAGAGGTGTLLPINGICATSGVGSGGGFFG